MDPDHFINCLRVYDGTDPIQIDLLRRQSKRRTTRAGLYRDDLVFFQGTEDIADGDRVAPCRT